jgi:hypothetical protein
MDPLTTSVDWKLLVSLTTAITGFVFSLAAYRRARAADKRSVRADEQGLVDAVVLERERALGEIHAVKAAWASRRAMMRMYDASDTEFDQLADEAMRSLHLAESTIKAISPHVTTREDLVRFRTDWVARLQKMRTDDTVIEKAFGELMEKLKTKPSNIS